MCIFTEIHVDFAKEFISFFPPKHLSNLNLNFFHFLEVVFLHDTLPKRLAPFNNYSNPLHVHLYDHF